jgi:hypothetical protein
VDLSPYVDQLRRELAVAAELGGEDARALADRLTTPLESAVRLALLSALSSAAEEITGQLAPGSVDVRLRGGDIGFVVTPPPAPLEDDHPESPAAPAGPPAPEPTPDTDEGGTSRVTLRLPEQLKTRIEEAARREGFSLNAWLVRAVTRALDPGTAGPAERRRTRWSGQQYSGWVR